MCGSLNNFDDTVRAELEWHRRRGWLRRVLDVGVGAGKYGRMVKSVDPTVHLEGVEAEPQQIHRFGIDQVYDRLRISKAIDLVAACPDDWWDVVVIGDCLEHMPKSEGLDLVHFLIYRTRCLMILWPRKYHQGATNGPFEPHISVWLPSEFAPFGGRVEFSPPIYLAVLPGYVGDPETTGEPYKAYPPGEGG